MSEDLYPLSRAAPEIGVSRATLRRAIEADRVPATMVNGRPKLTRSQLDYAKTLRCPWPGCPESGATPTGRCRPHARRPLPGSWSATALARCADVTPPTITAWTQAGSLKAERVTETPSGLAYLYSDETAQRLLASRCSHPDCDSVTPFVDRCWRHPIGSDLVEQTCGWCKETFLVEKRVLARGKGKYCSHSCNAHAQHAADPKSHPNLTAIRDGIVDHRRRIAETDAELADQGWRTAKQVADLLLVSEENITGTGGFYRRGLLEGRVHTIYGSPVLRFHVDAIAECETRLSKRAAEDRRQMMQLEPDFRVKQARGAGLITTIDDKDQLVAQVKRRRRNILRHNRGPKPKDALKEQLLASLDDLAAEEPEIIESGNPRYVAEVVGLRAFTAAPRQWPYDPGLLENRDRGIKRVWNHIGSEIKVLQMTYRINRAA